ncbi:DUF305 domain-containing protein [Burkholderia catarinensis]|uniref:DUF305 domain-containing protein n=1 Tax=Burkholderia catarinensis TaxID=1108140 RepID=UPI0010084D5C|nr:DUF305 domain-containing protein [Burkholderia catarinensis]KAG8154491.1 hypothetical protein BFF94_006930 [Burkholderia catarinensis]
MKSIRVRRSRVLVPVAVFASFATGAALSVFLHRASAVEHPADARETVLVVNARSATANSSVDVGFAQDMSLHHEQAVLMAQLAYDKGSMRVRALAERILHEQLVEIGQMQGWLMLWQAPRTTPQAGMMWMVDAYRRSRSYDEEYERLIDQCRENRNAMPGLATNVELDRLMHSRGPAFDTLFLSLMLRHHLSALTMARFASEYGRSFAVRSVAQSMIVGQRQEIAEIGVLTTMARHSHGG